MRTNQPGFQLYTANETNIDSGKAESITEDTRASVWKRRIAPIRRICP